MPGVVVESADIGMNETISILKKFTLGRGRQTHNQIILKQFGKNCGQWGAMMDSGRVVQPSLGERTGKQSRRTSCGG